jgi:hypothetical protein
LPHLTLEKKGFENLQKYTDKKGKSRIYYPDISILDTKIIYEIIQQNENVEQ